MKMTVRALIPASPGGVWSSSRTAAWYLCMRVTLPWLSALKISLATSDPSSGGMMVPDSVRTSAALAAAEAPLAEPASMAARPSSDTGTQKLPASGLYQAAESESLSTNVMPCGAAPASKTSSSDCAPPPAARIAVCAASPTSALSPAPAAAARLSTASSGRFQSCGALAPTPQCRSSGPGPASPASGSAVTVTVVSFTTVTRTWPLRRPFLFW
mmetsp:Transcript_21243/g.44593  ORF Transcript_21243/g.44593 Transcript_21243/m.44593 type:complete len:214 (+) Transcript_21243:784-1425(+)